MQFVKTVIEVAFSLCLLANAMLFLPQAFKILKSKCSKNLSLLTFAGFNVIQLVTVLHGYLRRDYILMIGTFLSLFTCSLVTLLIMIYKKKGGSKW